jgi:hypothetical protein
MSDPYEKIADQWDRDDGLDGYFGETKQEMADRLERQYPHKGRAEVRSLHTGALLNGETDRAKLIAAARPLTFYPDFDKSVPLDWVVKNVLARGHTSYLFGPPGGGKSALYGSAAVCLGSSPDWYGFKIKKRCASVYFAFERPDLVKKRIWSQCQRDGLGEVPVAVAPGLINLMDPKCVSEIIGTILAAEDKLGLEAGLAIFDTFSKGIAAGGGDENQAKDQNRVWGHLRLVHEGLARYHSIHLGAIGHTGKDESRGPRGSNAADGDNDVSLQIRDDGTAKSVDIYKANELPEGPLMRFKMEPFDTGLTDEDGDAIEVWIAAAEVVEPGNRTSQKVTMTDKQAVAFDALVNVCTLSPPPRLNLSFGMQVATMDMWRDELFRRGLNGENRVRDFERRWEALLRKRLIQIDGDFVWSIRNGL